jgi:PadR family transcriptional regulator PadR
MPGRVEQMPLVKGSVDLLVLKALTMGPMHGFGIALWLEDHSSGALTMDDSAMYQVLHRLEGRGFVSAEWGTTKNNRSARFYRLSAAGRAHLRTESEVWLRYSALVAAILKIHPRQSPA